MTQPILSGSKLYDFIIALDNATSFEHCFSLLTEVIKQFGFDGVLYTFLPTFFSQPILKACDNYGDDYIQHYVDHNLMQFDHVMAQARSDDSHIIHWYNELDTLCDEALMVVETTKKYGICNGVSIRTFLLKDGLAMAGVSLICKKDESFFQEVCLPNVDILKVIVDIFHQKIVSKYYHQSVFLQPALKDFNPSKLAVLKGLAEGNNLKNIADELNLNPKYVSNMTTELPKNFGCKNRDQLLYVAGMLELAEVIKKM